MCCNRIPLTQYSPSVGYVAHPQGSAADVRKAIGIIGRFSNGAYLTAISDKDRDLEVSYHIMISTFEVEPLLNRHHWDQRFCPL